MSLVNCGATVGFLVDVTLKRWGLLRDRVLEVDASHTGAELDVDGYWDSPHELSLYFDRRLKVAESQSRSGSTRVRFVACDVTTLASAESPNGDQRAIAFLYTCGDRVFTRIRVDIFAMKRLRMRTVFLGVNHGPSEPRLHWDGADHLVVEYSARLNAIDKVEEEGSAKVSYRTF